MYMHLEELTVMLMIIWWFKKLGKDY